MHTRTALQLPIAILHELIGACRKVGKIPRSLPIRYCSNTSVYTPEIEPFCLLYTLRSTQTLCDAQRPACSGVARQGKRSNA